MNFKDILDSLILPVRRGTPQEYLVERKRLEWIFIAVRFLWVPVIFILARLHHPALMATMMILGGALGFLNVIACVLNAKIKSAPGQKTLGMIMLTVDTLIAWGIILLFVKDFYTAAYAMFVYIIIEGAIRFSMKGSLLMAGCFIVGLYVAYWYRSAAFDVRFSVSGYVFWTILMSIVAVVVGAIVREGQKQRAVSEKRLKENTLLTERHRLARELHDSVLKTLQGLALEARALGNRTAGTSPSVKETAQYIEEVCTRTGKEIREVIFDLHQEDVPLGIGKRISGLAHDWTVKTGIPAELKFSGQGRLLAPETARQLLKIVSEALTNTERHAAATAVSINLEMTGAALKIEIKDNGRGIPRGPAELYRYVGEGRLGLAGMKERAEVLGGNLLIESGPGGTNIKLEIPLPPVVNHE